MILVRLDVSIAHSISLQAFVHIRFRNLFMDYEKASEEFLINFNTSILIPWQILIKIHQKRAYQPFRLLNIVLPCAVHEELHFNKDNCQRSFVESLSNPEAARFVIPEFIFESIWHRYERISNKYQHFCLVSQAFS